MADKLLGQEIQQHISSLKQALNQVNSTKNNLALNAQQAKSRIHNVVSRQLESLRNREVWLLSQVDLIQGTKDDLLRKQAEDIHRALGALHSCVQCLEAGDSTDLDSKINDTIDRLKQLELYPVETPHLGFRADIAALRQAIHGFGKVDTHSLPMELAFADPEETGCSSLPKAFEEYEDLEHHTMYKTVQDITTSDKCTKRTINVTAPKLTVSPSDWLFLPPEVQPTQYCQTVPEAPQAPKPPTTLSFPPFQSDLNQWLLDHQSKAAKASVQQWLQEIKSQSELEEEEDVVPAVSPFGETSSAVPSSIDVLSLPRSSPSDANIVDSSVQYFPYFDRIATASTDEWIQNGTKGIQKSTSFEKLKYFSDASGDPNVWLHKYKVSSMDQAKTGCCGGSSTKCSPVHQVPQIEIEDLDTMPCSQEPSGRLAWTGSSNPADWLKGYDAEKDVDEQEFADKHGIMILCKANEPCKTFTDCVCDDNCASQLMQNDVEASNPAVREWLMKPKSPAVLADLREAPLFEYFREVGHEAVADWLANCDVNKQVDDSPVADDMFPPFTKTIHDSQWLATTSQSLPSIPVQCQYFQQFAKLKATKSSDWIKPSGPTAKFVKAENAITSKQFSFSHRSDDVNMWLSVAVEKKKEATPPPQAPLINPWLQQPCGEAKSDSAMPSTNKSSDSLFKHLNDVQCTYTWSMCDKPSCEEPVSKEHELPEKDCQDDEAGKWLLVEKEDDNINSKEVKIMETNEMEGQEKKIMLVQSLLKNPAKQSALGEWLMSVHNDFD